MKYFSLDAIHDGLARLVDDDDGITRVDSALLPAEAGEGSMLYFDETAGRYCVDEAETARRRAALQAQLERILNRQTDKGEES